MEYQNEIEFTVFGTPVGKQRPRLATVKGKPIIYTPPTTRMYETKIKTAFRKAYPRFKLIEGYVDIELQLYYKIPKSVTKTRKEMMLSGEVRPSKKPDLDNVLKIIMDGLNVTAYRDDKQVISSKVEKFYAETGKVKVIIRYNE